jgi:hypothetical protein
MTPHIDPGEAGEPMSGDILKDLGFGVSDPIGSSIACGGTAKCECGPDCEFPCWQRQGLTPVPCCPGCPPLEMGA